VPTKRYHQTSSVRRGRDVAKRARRRDLPPYLREQRWEEGVVAALALVVLGWPWVLPSPAIVRIAVAVAWYLLLLAVLVLALRSRSRETRRRTRVLDRWRG